MSELRIYFEGDDRLRPGFRQFFREIAAVATIKGWRFAPPVATYGRPVQAFRIALRSHPNAWNVLLLDWEDEDDAAIRKQRLEGCDQESVFSMVQLMEAWFLADADALEKFFKKPPPKGNLNVEEIPKKDVRDRLDKLASGEYHKVKHGVKLLELVDPAKVRKAAPNCERMFRVILAKLA